RAIGGPGIPERHAPRVRGPVPAGTRRPAQRSHRSGQCDRSAGLGRGPTDLAGAGRRWARHRVRAPRRHRGGREDYSSVMTSATHSPPAERLRALPLRCRLCGTASEAQAVAICGECLGPLDPDYGTGRRYPGRDTIASRPASIWRYREWLPFDGEPLVSLDTGFTPLL